MGTQIFLGKPPPSVIMWIVKKAKTYVKYTAASGLSDWEDDIVGELTRSSIPNKSNAEVVEIGSHVTSIGEQAFEWCDWLTSVTIPNNVTNIKMGAFYHCSILASIIIPSSITNIQDFTFAWCNNLTSVTIPGSVTSIGENAFSYCSSLTSITIPDNVTSIGENIFYNCSSLTSVTFSGKSKATVQGLLNYSWQLPSGCVIHCTDGDITI